MLNVWFGEPDSQAEKHGSNVEDMSTSPTMTRQGSFASGSSAASTTDSVKIPPDELPGMYDDQIAPRLQKNRPQCIICSDDGNAERQKNPGEIGPRKSRRRRNEGGKALSFVGYT